MKLMYWKDVDLYVTEKIPMGKDEWREETRHVTKQLTSDCEAVEKIWLTGSTSMKPNDYTITLHLNIILKNGNRYEKEITPEQGETLEIPEAIEYLTSLNKK